MASAQTSHNRSTIGSVFSGAGAGTKAAMSHMPTPKWTALWKWVLEHLADVGAENSTARESPLFQMAFRETTSNIWPGAAMAFCWVMAASITAGKPLRKPITQFIFGADFTHRLAGSTTNNPGTTATPAPGLPL